MKLISLSDFVLEKNELGLFVRSDEQIRRYAYFLQKDLKLSMFLPCDNKNNLLFEPQKTDFVVEANYYNKSLFKKAEHKYKKAVSNVIFAPVSFDIVEGQRGIRFYRVGNTQVFNLSDDGKHLYWHHYTIESLLSEMDETINFIGSF